MEPTRRRVLITADAVGGVWTYALDLAGGLAARGTATLLAVLGPAPSPGQRQAAASIPGLELVETGLPLDWTAESPDGIRAAGDAVAAIAREGGVDLVHLNSPALAAGTAFSQPLVVGCHSCVATWWAAMRGTALPRDFMWRTELVAAGYAAADALIAPTRAFADATAAAYGIAAPRVVHNGRFKTHIGPSVLPGIGERAVFTAGRLWDEGKNIALLDHAAAQLNAPVRAAGSTRGPNGAAIAFTSIEPLGNLASDEIAARFAARPIFCSPARYEPFGLAVLEAAAAGCALVLSDIPSFRELWQDAAVFVSPEDDLALARQLRALLDDPAERARLGEAARLRARRYNVDAMVEGTAAIYDTVIGQAARHTVACTVERSSMQHGLQGVSR
jgi:glycogen(starch) synthase